MEYIISVTEAQARLSEWMQQAVESGQPVIIERDGKSHVVLLAWAEYERLRQAQKKSWRELVRQARAQAQADLGERQLPPPAEIIQQAREARDEQLVGLR